MLERQGLDDAYLESRISLSYLAGPCAEGFKQFKDNFADDSVLNYCGSQQLSPAS